MDNRKILHQKILLIFLSHSNGIIFYLKRYVTTAKDVTLFNSGR